MKRNLILLAMAMLAAIPVAAVESAFWQVGSYEEFLQGTLRDISLNREGRLRLAPESRTVFSPDETLALSLATDKNKNIFIGTGHQGKVFKVDSSGKGSLFFTSREPEIFALAVAADGALLVGSSPEGKIYRVTPDGKSTTFNDPASKYIWALTLDAKGNLFAATGDQGKIFKIDPAGKSELFFDSKQTHVMCLTLDRDGNLLAGSVPNGLIFRITPQAKAFVLYQSNHPEIHDLALDAEGRIYAAALGGAGGKGTPDLFPGKGSPVIAPGVTTVTVTASTERAAQETPTAQTPGQAPGGANAGRPAPQASAFPVTQIPPGRGSLILIRPDNTVETVWSSNTESIFGLAVRGNQVLFSTDSNGRIFELDPTKDGPKVTLLAQTRETLATRILLQGTDLYVATSNIAKLFRLTGGPGKEGSYESSVKDTKFISKWGNLTWRADAPSGSTLEFYTRSGNSDRPDHTWSDWAGPYKKAEGETIQSPSARFLQWKAVFKSSNDKGPDLSEVTVSYLNQNLPPQVRSVSAISAGDRSSTAGATAGGSGNITVTVGGPSSAAMAGAGKTPTIISWQADDPNGDQLAYSVYVRDDDEEEWHLLKDDLRQTTFTIESSTLADGKYVARVVASDGPSNPASVARQAELTSSPFWVDNTPPTVTTVKTEVNAGGVEVHFLVHDTVSPIRHAEASVDGEDWVDANSDDGIVDSMTETFSLKPGKLGPGEHVILLRAFDAAGNAGVGKAVVRVTAGTAPSR
jgi:hypothetical protein